MNTVLSRVLRIGSHPQTGSTFCKIEFDGERLSITGVEGPKADGNCKGSCGQIVDSIEIETFAPGWTAADLNNFKNVWQRWHLNDMRAGCEHQRELGWKSYDEHPSEPCPVCGYKYGSKWLKEVVPGAVIEFLKSLPETDVTPAWV